MAILPSLPALVAWLIISAIFQKLPVWVRVPLWICFFAFYFIPMCIALFQFFARTHAFQNLFGGLGELFIALFNLIDGIYQSVL